MREELLEIAGDISRANETLRTSREHHPLPSSEELDEMAKFSSSAAECEVLCQELLDLGDALGTHAAQGGSGSPRPSG